MVKFNEYKTEIEYGLILIAKYKVVDFQVILHKVFIQNKEVLLDEFGLEMIISDIIDSDFDEREQIENDYYELL